MNIEFELKKEGIEVTRTLDTLKVNAIAKNIAQKLVSSFPEHDFKLGELFIKLSRIKMYIAKVPQGLSEANYFYKNCSIYFNEKVDLNKIDKLAMHECIHYLQERKDKKGHLIRLGLCDLTEFKVNGLGLNEAAVQLATSKALKNSSDHIKYYGISFDTISPNYYPLECNLISQMAYITGEYDLFDSTFNSNNHFKEKFIKLTSEKTFRAVQNNFDKILYAEEELIKLNNKLEDESIKDSATIHKINSKITKIKKEIQATYFDTQDTILTSYFNKAFNNISDLENVENYRRKLYNYKNLIGSTEDYHFFNNYYIDQMSKLENKYNQIENGELVKDTSLAVVKQNKLIQFIKAIKKFLFKSGEEFEKIDE